MFEYDNSRQIRDEEKPTVIRWIELGRCQGSVSPPPTDLNDARWPSREGCYLSQTSCSAACRENNTTEVRDWLLGWHGWAANCRDSLRREVSLLLRVVRGWHGGMGGASLAIPDQLVTDIWWKPELVTVQQGSKFFIVKSC